MNRLRTILERLRRERGHTLVEFAIASMMMLVLLATAFTISQVVAKNEPVIRERAGDIERARVLVERVDRELRLARSVDLASPNRVVLETYVRRLACGGAVPPAGDNRAAIPCEVEYVCTGGACIRTERAPVTGVGTGGASQQLVAGLDSSTPFSCVPACSSETPQLSAIDWLGVSLRFPAENGEDSITLSGGTSLRNT